MNKTMSQHGYQPNSRAENNPKAKDESSPKDKLGDYVDFEEIDE